MQNAEGTIPIVFSGYHCLRQSEYNYNNLSAKNLQITKILCIFAAVLQLIERNITMATAIRAIPTLYGETAKSFESEATQTELNPGTQDYRHEAKVVSDFLKTCTAL